MPHAGPASAAKAEAGAPGEITDEMIDAGVSAYRKWDRRFEEEEGLVLAVFTAMRLAQNNVL